MARTGHFTGRFGGPHKWRKRIMGVALLVLLVLASSYVYLTRPERLAKLTGGLLENLSGAEVDIGEVTFAFDGRIHLSDVRLSAPGAPGKEARVFEVKEMLIKHELFQLAQGKFEPTSITLSQPTLRITEYLKDDDPDYGVFNYQLLRTPKDNEDEKTGLPDRLPEIFVRQGRIVWGDELNGDYQERFSTQVDGKLTESSTIDDTYYLSLRSTSQGDIESSPTLAGRLNLETKEIDVEVEDFTLVQGQQNALPRNVRKWWATLNPEGSVPRVSMGYVPLPKDDAVVDKNQKGHSGFRIVIEVQGVALSLPYLGDEESPVEDRRQFRLTEVSGRFEMVDQFIEVRELTGNLEGVEYTINGEIDGLGVDAPFDFRLSTNAFHIPDQPPFMPALPGAVRTQFDKFKPTGTFQVAANVRRTGGPDARLAYDGKVTLSDCGIVYYKFPFALEHVNGSIAFDNDTMTVEMLGDGAAGGTVDVYGEIHPPGPDAAYSFKIDADDIPISEELLPIVPEKYRDALQMFAYRKQLEKLEELKLINADPSNPEFEIGGLADLDITADRPYGEDTDVQTRISIDLNRDDPNERIGMMFKYWPYPVYITGGVIVIHPDRHIIDEDTNEVIRIDPAYVEADNVTGTGPHGGRLVANGIVALPKDVATDERTVVPHIDVKALDTPVDALLMANIPPPPGKWLEQMSLTGMVDVQCRVFLNEEDKIDVEALTLLRDGSARPNGKQFVIDDLNGRLTVKPNLVTVHELTGRREDASLRLSGQAKSTDGQWRFDTTVDVEQLPFESPILDLIPETHEAYAKIKEVLDTYKPAGEFDAHISYSNFDQTKEYPFSFTLIPRRLAFDLQDKRVELDEMQGSVIIDDPNVLQLHHLAADFGMGSFTLHGMVQTGGEDPFTDLTFTAKADEIDETARLALPKSVISVIDGLEITGGYEVTEASLFFRPGGEDIDGSPLIGAALDFSGNVKLVAAAAAVGVTVEDLNGSMDITAVKSPRSLWPIIDVRLNADSLRASDRIVDDLHMRIQTGKRSDLLELSDFEGSVYGGQLLGTGQIDLRNDNRYKFEMKLLDAPLDPVIKPKEFVKTQVDGAPLTREELLKTGRLSATLTIDSTPGDPNSRSGRGLLEIREAEIYKAPLTLAILQILKLSGPTASSFDRADARFILDGDDVLFDHVSISAPSFQIVGDGTMRYSDLGLDLTMYTENPRGIPLGPISEIKKVIDREAMTIRVVGTLNEPKTKVVTLSGIRGTWNQIFGVKERKKSRDPTFVEE